MSTACTQQFPRADSNYIGVTPNTILVLPLLLLDLLAVDCIHKKADKNYLRNLTQRLAVQTANAVSLTSIF